MLAGLSEPAVANLRHSLHTSHTNLSLTADLARQ
jgi:hypothetical protein